MQLTVDTGHPRFALRRVEIPKTPAFNTVVLDVDRCISDIDGLEWLAAGRGDLLPATLAAIRPRRHELDALAQAYLDTIAPDCADTIAQFRRAGVRVVIVSRGPRHAMYRLAYRLGIDPNDVHAVDIRFDALGAYAGVDNHSPLTGVAGKDAVVAGLDVEGPVLVAGDGPAEHRLESFAQLASTVLS